MILSKNGEATQKKGSALQTQYWPTITKMDLEPLMKINLEGKSSLDDPIYLASKEIMSNLNTSPFQIIMEEFIKAMFE